MKEQAIGLVRFLASLATKSAPTLPWNAAREAVNDLRHARKTTGAANSERLGVRLAKGAFWSITGAVIARGLALVASIFAARMLGVQGFGELGIIQSTVGMFGSLAGCGLGLTATKHVAEFRKNDPSRTGRIIGLCYLIASFTGALAAVALIAFAPWLARQTLAAPHLTEILRLSAGIAFLGVVTGLQSGVVSGFEAFKPIARINLVAGLLAFPMLIAGVGWWGLEGAVWALTANLALTALLNHAAVRKIARADNVKIRFTQAIDEIGVLGRFTVFALLGGLMGVPLNWACNSILINQPGGYDQMGIFNAANQWRMIILFLPATVGGVALPMMANVYGQGDKRRYGKLLRYTVLLNGGVAFLIALPLIVLARFVLGFYGAEFVSGEFAFVLLTIAAVVIAVNNGVSRAIASTGAMQVDLLLHVAWGAAFLGAGWLLIPRFGVTGLGAATLFGAVFQAICQWTWLSRQHRTFARRVAVYQTSPNTA